MAIDAQHCPGAVMFLFRGYFGCLLFTGDFRWELGSERAREGGITLLNAIEDNAVDVLYLDNTYCNPSFAFPSRDVAAKQVVDIIASHPDHDVIIGIDSLGKEGLLIYIARELDIKIWVWPERLRTMHLLGFYNMFTTQTSVTRVRAVPRYSFSIDTLEGLNTMHPTIGIMPSGLPWMIRPRKGDDTLSGSFYCNRTKPGPDGGTQTDKLNGISASVEKIHECMYSVAYSDHSCFSEIGEFIKLVQPTNIKGIVSSSSCYIDPLYYFGSPCGLNQPSIGLHYKYQKKEGGKNVRGRTGSTYIAKKRKRAVEYMRVRLSKVNAFRKLQQGAKIAENDHCN